MCWYALRVLVLLAKYGLSRFAGWTALGCFLAAAVAARVKVPAHKQHSVTNTGTDDLIFLVIYDPPLVPEGTP